VRAQLTVVAKSIRSTISPLQSITATLITLGRHWSRPVARTSRARRPRCLCQQGAGVVASHPG
jgi:hypothetical protein